LNKAKQRKLKVFTDRHPLIGPMVWILTIEYFLVQVIVAEAWHNPYSFRFNTISDLGNTVCGITSTRYVCSPLNSLMNAAFIALGVLMAAGAPLIYQEFRKNKGTMIGFSLMAIAGFGTIVVGLFPENTIPAAHILGAAMPFLLGNISLVVLGLSLKGVSSKMRAFAIISGAVSLIALVFFLKRHYGWLGIGGVERIVSYPQTIWLIAFGIYMSKDHFLRIRSKAVGSSP
jgi:hypothetical membrane protein